MSVASRLAPVIVSSAHGRLISRAPNAADLARRDREADEQQVRDERMAGLLAEYTELGQIVIGSDITFKNPYTYKWSTVRSWADFKTACRVQAWRTECARLGHEPMEGYRRWRTSPAQWVTAAREIVADRAAQPSWMAA